MKHMIIYHAGCVDGFTAAWVAHRALLNQGIGADDIELVEGVYNKQPPDVTGAVVVIVDFSYKRDVLLEMAESAAGILIIDHHKTARDALAQDMPAGIFDWSAHTWHEFEEQIAEDRKNRDALLRCAVCTVFDMARSGAGLTWDFFRPDEKRPRLVDHVEDRDLWAFKLQGSREIHAVLDSYTHDLQSWDSLASLFQHNHAWAEERKNGASILRAKRNNISSILPQIVRPMYIGGRAILVANLPPFLISEACDQMLSMGMGPVVGCYWDSRDGRVFSLRSVEGGPDVAHLAETYGGGGHARAAGFTMPLGWGG